MKTDFKSDFPFFATPENQGIIFLDSAATAQKPLVVLEALSTFCKEINANVHRGVYLISQKATDAFEEARRISARFLGAESEKCIVFNSGTTMGINTIAYGWARYMLNGKKVLVSQMEHHANIVSWQVAGLELDAIGMNEDGTINLNDLESKLKSGEFGLVAVCHVSNVLGTLNPVKEISQIAHKHNVPVLIDGAQAAPHLPVNVTDIGCDFYAMSGHKALGPWGTGVLYINPSRHSEMHPFFGGGDMITNVTMSGSEFKKVPYLLESGTQNVGGAVALAKAFEYMDSIGRENIELYVNSLGSYAWSMLSRIPGIKLLGPEPGINRSSSLVSFTFEYDDAPHWIDNDAVASALDSKDICVRHGRFCAQPTVKWARLMPNGAVRASFHIYNTFEDVEKLAAVITRIEQTM